MNYWKNIKYYRCSLSIRTMIICILCLMFQSCEETDVPEMKNIKKMVSVYFDGNSEDVSHWTSFVAYTESHEPLYIIQNGDTIIDNKGTFEIRRDEVPIPGKVVLFSEFKDTGYIYISVTYRKRIKNPSETDDLKIRIQGYCNDILKLDTLHIMNAFRSDEKIDVSDYIYKLKI